MADQASEGLLSPYLRRQRLSAAMVHLKGRVLDVGCGSGALARNIAPDHYLGVDRDPLSLEIASSDHPGYRFQEELPAGDEKFDTVVALAVIEHVSSPAQFLSELAGYLKPLATARIIISTPHPSMDWIHSGGAALGLFSQHANDEHEELLDRAKLKSVGLSAGLRLVSYRRFLFGANQLAVFAPGESVAAGRLP